MIDVMKRLAEIDAQNSNVQKTDEATRVFYKGQRADKTAAADDPKNQAHRDAAAAAVKKARASTEPGSLARHTAMNSMGKPGDTGVRVNKVGSKTVAREDTNVSLEECGPMGMMGGMPPPHTPASINMTADSGSELTGMLRDIMQLAGVHQVGSDDLGHEHPPAVLSAEPIASIGAMAAEPMGAVDSMRSVLDKLNPEPEDNNELGAFQSGDEEDDDDREETDETADSMPDDPTNPPPADADEYAHHENSPGSGETSNGEKRQSNMPTATYESLMNEWKKFLNEDDEDNFDLDDVDPEEDDEEDDEESLDESTCSACHKDPCECSTNEQVSTESLDILHLAGLK